TQHIPCDDVLVAIGQENAFPWIERDIGMEFERWAMPKVDPITMQSSIPNVFFGGDAAFGPKNIIWAVAHGHEAAVSIDKFCQGEDVKDRPPPGTSLISQKMGIHEWSYDNDISTDIRYKVPLRDTAVALADIRTEVELGFDQKLGYLEAERCLNCDIETVFTGRSASNATRASISAPSTASPLPTTVPKMSCAPGSWRRRSTRRKTSISATVSRPAA